MEHKIPIEFDPNCVDVIFMSMPSATNTVPGGAPAFAVAATVRAAVEIALQGKRSVATRIQGAGLKILALLGYDYALTDADSVRRALTQEAPTGFDAVLFLDANWTVFVVAGQVPALD